MDNVFTQNRVSQAMPAMPQSVKNYGVTVKKALAFPLLVISVKSPKAPTTAAFQLHDAQHQRSLARISGVGQINLTAAATTRCAWLRRIGSDARPPFRIS